MAFNGIDEGRLEKLLQTQKGREAFAKADVSYAIGVAKSGEQDERIEEITNNANMVGNCDNVLTKFNHNRPQGKQAPTTSNNAQEMGSNLQNADQAVLNDCLERVGRGELPTAESGETGKTVSNIVSFNAGLNKRNAEANLKSRPVSKKNLSSIISNVFDGDSGAPTTPEMGMNGMPMKKIPTSTGKNNDVYTSANVQKAARRHAKRQEEKNYSYTANTINMGGVNTKINREVSDFGIDNLPTEKTPIENTEALIKKVTKSIKERVGDWHRVKSFAVVSGQLLINGVIHAPKLTKQLDRRKYISGTVEYLEAGCLASLFDWSELFYATNIQFMWFDTDYSIELGTFLNDGVPFTVPYYFKYFDKLQNLTICDHQVTREDLKPKEEPKHEWTDAEWEQATPKERDRQSLFQKVNQNRRAFDVTSTNLYNSVLNGYNLSPQRGTQAMQDFAVGSLSNYVRNKGNKNIIAFGFGTVGHSALAIGTLGLNFATHLTTGLIKTGINGLGSIFAKPDSKGFMDNGSEQY